MPTTPTTHGTPAENLGLELRSRRQSPTADDKITPKPADHHAKIHAIMGGL